MRFNRPDRNYWDNKFAAYMHDPIDKIFQIPGHEERAAKLLEIFGLEKPNETFWKKADSIASGFERGQVPSYSKDPNKNGAINFLKNPVITHPTSENGSVKIEITGDKSEKRAKKIHIDLINFIKENIGMRAGEGGYSDSFKSDPDKFAYARFLYTHLALRFKLAENDVANIGALWHRIPADTRFPDHTIWQHNALTSALCSCMELSKDENQVGIMVMSIAPVQPFIARARRLRDYWTGSVLLSWLAFEGIRWVMENLGPDHILYPSLIDQPLVNEYLLKIWKVKDVSSFNQRREIASLPNKFLFLIPLNEAEAISADMADQINSAWRDLCHLVEQQIAVICNNENGHISEIFKRQNKNLWNIQWVAVRLIDMDDRQEIKKLLPRSKFENQYGILEIFRELVKFKWNYEMDARGILYSASHSLAQSALAGQKANKIVKREPENGEKCHLCGEFEVVHATRHNSNQSASEYNKNIKQFWEKLKAEWKPDLDFRKNEKLCSVCLVKRIAYKALEQGKEHILNSSFKDSEGFPSTTEMALYNYFKRKNITDKFKKIKLAQDIHDEPDEKTDNRDRYYAILLMDGDHMGKLVSGETLASTWESVMHPEIVDRLQNLNFDAKYQNAWQKIFNNKHSKRLLTPSIHAAISESLGDFSIYGVAPIIEEYKGKLIYAGGDDVCAVLPVDTVLDAAEEIRKYYTSEFKLINDKESKDIKNNWIVERGKLSLNLGIGQDISISAGILICHHKESLSQMIAETHQLLDRKAKIEIGRNACAIELRKRSGGSRFFARKWNDRAWESFHIIGGLISDKNKRQISTSLVYRLDKFKTGIDAILEKENWFELMKKFIAKQLDRSMLISHKDCKSEFAEKMTNIVIIMGKDGKPEYKPEGLIVAAFIADKGD